MQSGIVAPQNADDGRRNYTGGRRHNGGGGGGDIILAAAFDREAGMEVDIVIARAAIDVVDGRWGFPAFDGARRWRMANDGADDDGGGGDAFNRSALNRMEVRGMAEAALMVQID